MVDRYKEIREINNKNINDEMIEKYRKLRMEMTEESKIEERFELEAAFGKGETLVNVLTGERITL